MDWKEVKNEKYNVNDDDNSSITRHTDTSTEIMLNKQHNRRFHSLASQIRKYV